MQLSLADFAIILDTLRASLRIADGAGMFAFTRETREELLQHMLKQGQAVNISTESDTTEKQKTHELLKRIEHFGCLERKVVDGKEVRCLNCPSCFAFLANQDNG